MPSACETDITGVVSMYALQLASGRPSALVYMVSRLDAYRGNELQNEFSGTAVDARAITERLVVGALGC